MSEDSSAQEQLPPESGRVYRTVTRYWPRIAGGLVITIGLIEFVVGGLTADSGVEFYLMAWATTSGGLWFMFEKAEKVLAEESRAQVATWLRETNFRAGIESVPAQFSLLFDHVFGQRHVSWQCFKRSSAASILAVLVVAPVMLPVAIQSLVGSALDWTWTTLAFGVGATMLGNLVPDYLSLLETRWTLRHAEREGSLVGPILFDFLATTLIAIAVWGLAMSPVIGAIGGSMELGMVMFVLGFVSTYLTSVWLWLYAASVLVSRVLLRMNNGVGFLLRATDVERQPFRSMGFVSVIITSVIFALGLPLVLLR